MNEIYFYSPSSHYLRPAYPINTGAPRPIRRAPDPRLTHSTADGFAWLAKLLWNHWTRRRSQGAERTELAHQTAVQRRIHRLSLEVPADLERSANPLIADS